MNLNRYRNIQVQINLFDRIGFLFVFGISLCVYTITLAPTVQFWDNGELIASAVTLGPSHPPGAPVYMILAKVFSWLPLSSDIACRLNFFSALCSALTISMTYLIHVQLLRRFARLNDRWIPFCGIIGALSFAFTDAFWTNATEAELYSLSMLITACLVWLILKWEVSERDDRILLAAAYLTGLAIGAHLMTTLILPAAGWLVYATLQVRNGRRFTIRSVVFYMLITAAGFLIIYPGIAQKIPLAVFRFGWQVLPMGLLFFAVVFGAALRFGQKHLVRILLFYGLILIGYSTYGLIPIRSALNPPLDTGDPQHPEQLLRYIEREQFGSWGLLPRRYPDLPGRVEFVMDHPKGFYPTFRLGKQLSFFWKKQVKELYLRYVGWQFIGRGTQRDAEGRIKGNLSLSGLWGIPFVLILAGAFFHFRRDRIAALMVLGLFIASGLLIITYLNQLYPQPRERDGFYTASYWALSLWIGPGIHWLTVKFRRWRSHAATFATFVLCLCVPGILLIHGWPSHQRKQATLAHEYARDMLQSCDQDAILFVQADNDTYPLFYLQMVEQERPDITLINLSMLNQPVYIFQLLNRSKGAIHLSYTESQIRVLKPAEWQTATMKIPVPRQAFNDEIRRSGDSTGVYSSREFTDQFIRFVLKPTLNDQAIRVFDYVALDLIAENAWQRPVYFAMTVSPENRMGLQPYLQLSGMNYRLRPYRASPVDTLLTKSFLNSRNWSTDHRGVNLENDPLSKGMLGNYRVPAILLAQEYIKARHPDSAIQILRMMEARLPFDSLPPLRSDVMIQASELYRLAGAAPDARRLADLLIFLFPDDPEAKQFRNRIVSLSSIHQAP